MAQKETASSKRRIADETRRISFGERKPKQAKPKDREGVGSMGHGRDKVGAMPTGPTPNP